MQCTHHEIWLDEPSARRPPPRRVATYGSSRVTPHISGQIAQGSSLPAPTIECSGAARQLQAVLLRMRVARGGLKTAAGVVALRTRTGALAGVLGRAKVGAARVDPQGGTRLPEGSAECAMSGNADAAFGVEAGDGEGLSRVDCPPRRRCLKPGLRRDASPAVDPLRDGGLIAQCANRDSKPRCGERAP